MRSSFAGPQSSQAKSRGVVTDPGKYAASGTSGEFRRVSSAAGPQASGGSYVSTQDIGKQVAAGTGGEFRRISNASGPQASAGQYVSTQDIGKQVAAGTGGEYRRIVTATGPAASAGQYRATLDPGIQAPSSAAGSPAAFYSTQAGVDTSAPTYHEPIVHEPRHSPDEKQ
eukprot:Phypoly_transcript_12078.p2 GENE.Phypoly_transcript_12078~~Phypoly_transcript_12078.p2  ORF type:complete len:170 (-),score=29.30 Phypoly_transcript_12078:159-668(-)